MYEKENGNENENENGARGQGAGGGGRGGGNGRYDHERLEVYQAALRFIEWRGGILRRLPASNELVDQLDRASTSIALNIAEGSGEWSRADRSRFYRMARRSATECAAVLDIVEARRLEPPARMAEGKNLIHRVIAMLTALARANRAL